MNVFRYNYKWIVLCFVCVCVRFNKTTVKNNSASSIPDSLWRLAVNSEMYHLK